MANLRSKSNTPLFWILMLFLLLITLFPVYWIVVTSLKTPLEVVLPHPTFFPKTFTFQNYQAVLQSGFLGNMRTSLIVSISSTLISLVLSFCAAYALSRFQFPWMFNTLFLVWILLVKILPPVVLAIPLYTMFNSLGLINKIHGLVLVYQVYTLPYCIWMLFGFLKALPLMYEEAAQMDGAGKMATFAYIVLPMMRTGLVATSIFSVITAWDEFLFGLLFIRTPSLRTLPLVIADYIGEYETLWGNLMSIGMITALPILLFSHFVYSYYTKGFAMGDK
ncbi:MAG: carbohydrate ABC transporter permease [Sphaerochaeta sp.]